MTKSILGRLLKEARKARGLRQRDVCEKFGLRQSTLSAWETGAAEPNIAMFLKLCGLYEIEDIAAYFSPASGIKAERGILSGFEREILRHLRGTDERGRAEVKQLLAFSAQWVQDTGRAAPREKRAEKKPPRFGLRKLPYFAQPAAAGLGNYLEENVESELIEIDAPPEADAVIRISGDSMEPLIHDGDKIFLQYMPSVEEGEIGIFVLNGDAYCKQLCYENGRPMLVSLNPAYKPILIHDGDQIVTHGKVLLP